MVGKFTMRWNFLERHVCDVVNSPSPYTFVVSVAVKRFKVPVSWCYCFME